MNSIFSSSMIFNGDIDISRWDVSGVTDMGNMFERTKFNNEITEWDVRMFSVVTSFVKDSR